MKRKTGRSRAGWIPSAICTVCGDRRLDLSRVVWLVVAGWLVAGVRPAAIAQTDLSTAPLQPARGGLFVIEAARDSTRDFRWVPLPALGLRCLVWSGGVITIPESLETAEFGVADLTLPFSRNLVGVSAGRRLVFADGRFLINQPLMLRDGANQIFLAKGDILIEEGRIVYRMRAAGTDPRAQYLLLAGIILMTVVLMVRVRSRLRRQ